MGEWILTCSKMRYMYVLSISAIFSSISMACWIISCWTREYRSSRSIRLYSSSFNKNSIWASFSFQSATTLLVETRTNATVKRREMKNRAG